MSTTPKANQEEASCGAILWIKSMDDRVAPDDLGGQTAEEQWRTIGDRAREDGLTLERALYVVNAEPVDPDLRLALMLQILEQTPLRHVYVSGAIYANDTEDDRVKHGVTLFMHGSRLTICDDE